MPPKKSPVSISQLDDFEKKFATLETLALAKPVNVKRTNKAFKALSSDLKVTTSYVNFMREQSSFAGLKGVINTLTIKIGLAYFYHHDIAEARRYLQLAVAEDISLQARLQLIRLEASTNDLNTIMATMEQLLHAAKQDKHAAEAQAFHETIKTQALGLLNLILLNPQHHQKLNQFTKKYSQFFEVEGYRMLLEFYQDNPAKQADWRAAMFDFVSRHPNKQFPNLRSSYVYQADYYMQQKKYALCFALIDNNISQFEPTELAEFAFFLFYQAQNHPQIVLHTVKTWLIEAAETGDVCAIGHFLEILDKTRSVFNLEKTFAILAMACAQDHFKEDSHYLWGTLYLEHYAGLSDDKEAFKHFELAAACGHVSALCRLGDMHSKGRGTEINYTKAFVAYEEAHRLNSPFAAIVWAELFFHNMVVNCQNPQQDQLAKALLLLNECEGRDSQVTADIKYYQGLCLFYLDSPKASATAVSSQANNSNAPLAVQTIHFSPSKENPAMIKALEYSAQYAEGRLQTMANFLLGGCYTTGRGVTRDFEKALQYYHNVVALNSLDKILSYSALMACGAILQLSCEQLTGQAKKIEQFKALNYFQQAMNIQGDELPPEIISLVNKIYLKQNNQTLPPQNSELLLQHYSSQLQVGLQDDWQKQVSQLNDRLDDPLLAKTPATLREITKILEIINERLLDQRELLPKLGQFVSDCVAESEDWDALSILSVFRDVGKWHLASATRALEPLFMYLHPKLLGLRFSQLCEGIKWIAQCNFTPQMQEKNVRPLLQIIQETTFTSTLASDNFSIIDAAQLFYALSLLDCNLTHAVYLNLAERLFQALKPKLVEAGHYDISQLFHAYHYFCAHYPKAAHSWVQGADLAYCFEVYRTILAANNAIISNNQRKIYECLLKLYPAEDIRQEVLITEAGRRVDFLIGTNLIIQYNGSLHHNVWDDEGNFAYDTLKEQLCYKTLTAADSATNYVLVRIKRTSWAALDNEEERCLYLQRRIKPVAHLLKTRRDIEPTERKVPGHFSAAVEPLPNPSHDSEVVQFITNS